MKDTIILALIMAIPAMFFTMLTLLFVSEYRDWTFTGLFFALYWIILTYGTYKSIVIADWE